MVSNSIVLDDILITALQIKAYDDWRLTFKKLSLLHNRIVKKPKGGLAQKMVDADQNWFTFDFNKKHEILEIISNEICHLYKINKVGVFNVSSYKMFLKEHFANDTMNTMSRAADAFYNYYKVKHLEYSNIVFSKENFLFSETFSTVTHVLAHELAHAIIDEYGRNISCNLPDYKKWHDQNIYLDQDYLDPLDTVGFLKFYEKRNCYMTRKNRTLRKKFIDSYDCKNNRYREKESLHNYMMGWEERCAEAFAYEVVSNIQSALLDIGSPSIENNKKSS